MIKDKLVRPAIDDYFMNIAFAVSLRSEDPDTRHGCVIVSKEKNIILGTGYNGVPRGVDTDTLDMTRPNKYAAMIHAEVNALLNTSVSLNLVSGGIKLYVTGLSCNQCLGSARNAGIDEFIFADRKGTQLESDFSNELFHKIVNKSKVKIRTVPMKQEWLDMLK